MLTLIISTGTFLLGISIRGLFFKETNKIQEAVEAFISESKTIAETDKDKVKEEFNTFTNLW